MIDPLTITDEPTARAHADMIFVSSMEGRDEIAQDAEWIRWEALSWDQRKVKASEILRQQRNSAAKTGA